VLLLAASTPKIVPDEHLKQSVDQSDARWTNLSSTTIPNQNERGVHEMIRLIFAFLCVFLFSACATKSEYPVMGTESKFRLIHPPSKQPTPVLPTGSYAFVPDGRAAAGAYPAAILGLLGVVLILAASASPNQAVQPTTFDMTVIAPALETQIKATVDQFPALRSATYTLDKIEAQVVSWLSLYFIKNSDGSESPALRLMTGHFPDGHSFIPENLTFSDKQPNLRYYHWISAESRASATNASWTTGGDVQPLQKQVLLGVGALLPLIFTEMQTRTPIVANDKSPLVRIQDQQGPSSALPLCARTFREDTELHYLTAAKGYACKETTGVFVVPKSRFELVEAFRSQGNASTLQGGATNK
jgi:hypothetical protein